MKMYVLVEVETSKYFYVFMNNNIGINESLSKANIFYDLDLAKKQCEICNEVSNSKFLVKEIILQDV